VRFDILLYYLDKDVRDVVRDQIVTLETIDRTYFGKDRLRQIKAKIDEITQLLDTKPVEFI
jgi:hypothetical protein